MYNDWDIYSGLLMEIRVISKLAENYIYRWIIELHFMIVYIQNLEYWRQCNHEWKRTKSEYIPEIVCLHNAG